MRIAYICADPGVPVFGTKGCSIHVQAVLQTLLKQGHSLDLFATRTSGEAPADLRSIPVHSLPRLPKGKSLTEIAEREKSALSANLELRLALKKHGPFDLVYERYSLWSCTGMEYARSAQIPGVLEVNAPLIEEQFTHRGLVNREAAQRITERVFDAATLLVAVSDAVATYLNSYPQTQGRVQVMANGVHPERYPSTLLPTLAKRSDEFVIGFVGSMKPWHDLPTLIRAFARLHQQNPQARLLLVGDGPERIPIERQLMDQVDQACREAVQFTGMVPPEQIPGLLASMDVAVAPYASHTPCYFSPLKVYEAMAAGLPVVASDIGQMAALLKPDAQGALMNGVLFPPGDADALADQLLQLWADSDLRSRLGQAARAQVLQDHSWDVIVQQILQLAELEMKESMKESMKKTMKVVSPLEAN